MRKKVLLTLLSACLIITGSMASVSAAGTSTDESWPVPNEVDHGYFGALFMDSQSHDEASFLVDKSKQQDPMKNPTCTKAVSPDCNLNDYYFDAVIPTCQATTDINCLEGIGAIDSTGKRIEGIYSRNYPNKAQNDYVGEPGLRIPSGTSGSFFTIPGVTHAGGDKFYARVLIKGGGTSGNAANVHDFQATLSPVATVNVNTQTCGTVAICPDAGWANADLHPNGRWGMQGVGYDGVHNCVAWSTSEHSCAQRYAFPAGYSFYMKMRINAVPSGWLHGRLSNPDLKISKSGDVTNLELAGNPVSVPVVYGGGQYVTLPQSIKDAYEVTTGVFKKGSQGGGFSRQCCEGNSDPLIRNLMSTPSPSGWQGIEELKTWLPIVNDKAAALMTVWGVRTLTDNEVAGANSCFADTTKVTGIVTTNSTEYSAGPPIFDKATGSLNYQVASPHFTPAGEVFKGNYDLVMASSVARCVYGFSSAPIKAEISVTSTDGSPQIATTVVGEANGWLHLQANNFEFSAPTVTAKLTQDAAPAAKPMSSIKKVAATITCVNGKLSKKVTTAACPKGWKKK